MNPTFKSLNDLQNLHDKLKAEQAEKARLEAERKERERQAYLEANLFRLNVGEVEKLKDKGRREPDRKTVAPIPYQHIKSEQAALQSSLSDEFDAASLLETDDNLSYVAAGVGMDVVKKLRQGHWSLQAQIDLHGMRRDTAREQIAEFIRLCSKQHKRCVKIIHGKGHGSVGKEPVLKNKVKNWLIQKEEVIAFCQATAADGGNGALLVLLKAN